MHSKCQVEKSCRDRELKMLKTCSLGAWFFLAISGLFFIGIVLSDMVLGLSYGFTATMLMTLSVSVGIVISFLLLHMREALRYKIELQNLLLEIQKSLEEKKDK